MYHVTSRDGTIVSYERFGSGPPLVLVHGSLSDHATSWALIRPLIENYFTVYAVSRRGRGETDATAGHSVEDEGNDIVAVLEAIGEPAFLLGHSYGAQVALAAAVAAPNRVRKLVLYEPPLSDGLSGAIRQELEKFGAAQDWEAFTTVFLRDYLKIPAEGLEQLKAFSVLARLISHAPPAPHDIQAGMAYSFDPDRFRDLRLPVLLQVGTESPRHLFATDALAARLPDVRLDELEGQGHIAVATAPELYAKSVMRFLLE